jgi:hypothetical protein
MPAHPVVEGMNRDVVRHGNGVPAEARRPTAELAWEPTLDRCAHSGDAVVGDEYREPRAPGVVGRALSVEAEDVRAGAEESGRVPGPGEQRSDDVLVERPRERQPGNERRHRAGRGREADAFRILGAPDRLHTPTPRLPGSP